MALAPLSTAFLGPEGERSRGVAPDLEQYTENPHAS